MASWTLREWQDRVLGDETLPTATKLFALYLSLEVDADMRVMTTSAEICGAIRVSSTTAVQANHALEASGYIERSLVHKTGTQYRLTMPELDLSLS